jgi:hypothetical protein
MTRRDRLTASALKPVPDGDLIPEVSALGSSLRKYRWRMLRQA